MSQSAATGEPGHLAELIEHNAPQSVPAEKKWASLLVAGLVLLSLALAACGPGPTASSGAPSTVVIAYQPGIGYANLIVMKAQGTLQKQFPKTHFRWKVLASGSAIRDGMVSNQIQVGAGGVGPFLIGWDKGVGWKLLAALNEMDLWLVTMNPRIQSLDDIKPGMKIGMPAPDSIQAIVLRKGAQQQLGNAHALDNTIVAIEHPLGVQALEHGQLAAHLSSPPFEFEEVAAGGHIILKSYDLFRQSTFNSVFMTQSFYNRYHDFAKSFYQDLVSATRFVNSHTAQAAQLLSQDQHGKVTASQFQDWMTRQGITYDTTPHGFMTYARFMHDIGLLSKVPGSMQDIELPTLKGAGS
jgi:NitT/TauT family transport system substrate-binding protein